jgi:hypothetical protein
MLTRTAVDRVLLLRRGRELGAAGELLCRGGVSVLVIDASSIRVPGCPLPDSPAPPGELLRE